MKRGRGRWGWRVFWAYLILLGSSHVVRRIFPAEFGLRDDEIAVTVRAVDADRETDDQVRIATWDLGVASDTSAGTVVLLHGSPGDNGTFRAAAPALASRFRVIVPDLPGFGGSTRDIPDYSIRAHAQYAWQLLDSLAIDRVHLVGFSLGGGVALHMVETDPERVESLVLLASIGVQEMELLGDYHLNHLIHGLQLGCLWVLREGVPHFGAWDNAFLGVPYARNFFDTDQRPLRSVLGSLQTPTLIVHGDRDPLVPPAAAREHYRLVPQSELLMLDDNHFMVFARPESVIAPIRDFLLRVAGGEANARSEADPARVARAAEPFDPTDLPRARGFTLFLLLALIAAATFVSEDLTSVSTGLLVARGTIGFAAGSLACFVGILLTDQLLYLAGRVLGSPALRYPPLRWIIKPYDVERSAEWFRRRGAAVVVTTRFLPGTRVATYFAAGTLRAGFGRFALYTAVAVALWAPLIVGLSAIFGSRVQAWLARLQAGVFLALVIAALTLLIVVKLVVPLMTHRGRRWLLGRWRRITRWEFWPAWLFYSPVVLYVLYLGVKHRALTLFTASNPGIEAGGFVGESKSQILDAVRRVAPHAIPRSDFLPATLSMAEREAGVRRFVERFDLALPVVLKPDVGERGEGVSVPHTWDEVVDYFDRVAGDVLVQEYVPGLEFGVFYYRFPHETAGHIYSITDKRLPEVVGDGKRTLERLILDDAAAIAQAKHYFANHARRLDAVPAAGERVRLVDVGTHCRGAVFLDGSSALTPALEAAIDEIGRAIPGFYFGRFDVRVGSREAFSAGRDFKIIELNGVTSEATHIYDPAFSLADAYRVLFKQWRLAFDIGAENRKRGTQPSSLSFLARALFRRYRFPIVQPVISRASVSLAEGRRSARSPEGSLSSSSESNPE